MRVIDLLNKIANNELEQLDNLCNIKSKGDK